VFDPGTRSRPGPASCSRLCCCWRREPTGRNNRSPRAAVLMTARQVAVKKCQALPRAQGLLRAKASRCGVMLISMDQ